jgi:hypothetical protein
LAKKIKEQVGGFVKKEAWENLDKADEVEQKGLFDF